MKIGFALAGLLILYVFFHRASSPATPSDLLSTPVEVQSVKLPSPRERIASPPKEEAKKNRRSTPVEESQEEQEELMAALAMERFESITDLPGARELALDIKHALQDDPRAIDLRFITEGPNHELRKDYLEYMIRDPRLREKWVKLMRIILESRS